MMIQKQDWLFGSRILFVDEKNRGSVILEIPKDKSGIGGADAWLYSLWVSKAYRKNRVAKSLMECVEGYARSTGVKSIGLSWDVREAKRWTLQWYMRLGYEEKMFGKHKSLLIKELKEDDNG